MRWICGSRCPARCPWMTSPPSWGTLRAARCATGSRRIPGTTPTSASTAPSPCSQARGDKARGRGGDRRPCGPGDGADPQQVRYSVGRYARGARRRCCRRPRGRGGRERPWTRGRPAGRAGRPARCPASSRRGCRRSCPTTRRRSRRSSPTRAQQRRAQGGVGRPKRGRRPSPTLRRPAAPPARGRLRRRGRLRGHGLPAPPTTTSSTP